MHFVANMLLMIFAAWKFNVGIGTEQFVCMECFSASVAHVSAKGVLSESTRFQCVMTGFRSSAVLCCVTNSRLVAHGVQDVS